MGDANLSRRTFQDAVAASAAVKDGARRVVILRDIARLQSKAGDRGGVEATLKLAVETVDSAPDEAVQRDPYAITSGTWKGSAASVVARAMAEHGKFDDALRMARTIGGYQKASALAEIAAH